MGLWELQLQVMCASKDHVSSQRGICNGAELARSGELLWVQPYGRSRFRSSQPSNIPSHSNHPSHFCRKFPHPPYKHQEPMRASSRPCGRASSVTIAAGTWEEAPETPEPIKPHTRGSW
jgi:hypothetical protein